MDEAEEEPSAPDVAAFLERRWHANHPVGLRVLALHLMQQPDLVDRVRPVVDAGLPVTVMWGELDDAWPVDQQALFAERLAASAVELRGLGHSPNAQDPSGTAASLLGEWRPGR